MAEILEECTTIPELIEFYNENSDDSDEEFDDDVVLQAAHIISQEDDEFASVNEYRDLMVEAFNRTEEVLNEIGEAIEALEIAEDVEEMDMMTENIFIDMESDEAMEDAQIEVQDVNDFLTEYKIFLKEIGESAVGLYGSDFEFTWGDMMNESFFGDFWGSSMNLDKIEQALQQMLNLNERINTLLEQFDDNYNETVEQIQARVNEEWDKYGDE